MANEREPFVLDFPDGQRVEDILKKAEANYSKAEIDVKMATKATMSDVERETKNLQNQINEIVRAPESGGDVAAEVYQARVGTNSVSYDTLNERITAEVENESAKMTATDSEIRTSVNDLLSAVNLAIVHPALEPGGLVGSTGEETTNEKRVRTGYLLLASENWTISVPEGFAGHGVYYSTAKQRVGETGAAWALVGEMHREAPADAAYVRIMFKSDPEAVITPSDVVGVGIFYENELFSIANSLLTTKTELKSEIGYTNDDVSEIIEVINLESIYPELEAGGLVASTGEETTNNKRVRTGYIRQITRSCKVTIPTGFQAVAVYYNDIRERVGADSTWRTDTRTYHIVDGTAYIRLMFKAHPESVITPEDVEGVTVEFPTELSKTIRERKAVNWNLNTLIDAGLYNHMNSSPVADHVPTAENPAKPFKLFNVYDGVTPSTVRQVLWSYTTGNIYVRYQISAGNFSEWRQIAFASENTYQYDSTNKVLNIDTNKCSYVFKYCEDNGIRLSAWRLYQGDLKVENSVINMWKNSDAEGVIKLVGEDDHLSGYHGDELNGTAQFYVDGVPLNMAADSSGAFTTLSIKCSSDVYHCQTSPDSETKAFDREKSLVFTSAGYEIHQHWTATDDVEISRGAQALFQCYKTANGNTVLYGIDSDYIVRMQGIDFDNGTIYLDKKTRSVSMYTVGGKITVTALIGCDNEYYTPNIRDFASQNRDKIYLDMFNGKSLNVGESINTGFKVVFQ